MVSNKKNTFSNIFIIVSILFILTMLLFYGGRFIYYYKNSHINEEVGNTLLADVIKSLSYSSSMLNEGDNLYYRGNVLNNYLYYSNRYYRILGIEDGNIVLVDDNISTMLPYNTTYNLSDINNWLNKNEILNSGIYYNSLIKPDKYLTKTKTCLDNYVDTLTCDDYTLDYVGLISLNQYLKANNNGKNFLNKSANFWFTNKDNDDHNWYIDSKNEVTITNVDTSLYGVRPVITLKSDTLYYGGSGTLYEPYLITLEDAENFGDIKSGDINIGSYITFNEGIWKVLDVNDEYYKIVSTDSISSKAFSYKSNLVNIKDKTSVLYYLNNDYLDTINTNLLVKGEFNISSYETSYLDKYNEKENLYVGLLEIGDLYSSELNNSLTITNTGRKGTIFKIVDGRMYSDSYLTLNEIRPVIFIKKNIKTISGYGTYENPYEVGEA